MARKIFTFFVFVITLNSIAQQKYITPKTHQGLRFTENKGQWDNSINYMVRMSNGNIYLENNKLTYFLFDYDKYKTFHLGGIGKFGSDATVKGHMFQMEFEGSQKPTEIIATNQLPSYENYFIGNDKTKWQSNVHNFKQVVYSNIYPNVDFEFLTNETQLKYNFIVKPGANYNTIQLKYSGAQSLKIENGNLIIETSIGNVIEEKPIALQVVNSQTIQIPCVFKLTGDVVSFELGLYDRNIPLIIDPVLVFAAQSGSTADNFGMTATYDAAGNFYAGGTVFALGYPTSIGAYSNVFNGPTGGTDIVVTKYNSTGTSQIYSTYLGGNESEVVSSLIVNSNNELYLYGSTGSSNFPMPSSTYDNTFNGGNPLSFVFNGTNFTNGTDIYVSKFSANGSVLLASTYIGGSDNDGVNHVNAIQNYNAFSTSACPNLIVQLNNLTEYKPDSLQMNYGDQYRGEIQLDKLGNVYVASSTRSSNFPAVNGFDNTLGGKQDAVVFKFDPTLNNLIWSNYLGGTGNDAGYSLIITDSLHTYVTGGTFSTDFPTTPGCYNTSYNGGKADGYIAKINANGNTILKGTYIGTGSYDQSYFIQKDKNYNIYVYGQSQGNMPIVGAVYSNPNSHQFISQFNNQLTTLNKSTVIGSGQSTIDISPSAFGIDNCGNIYISGWGGNITNTLQLNGMATTANALYLTPPNGFDFYLMALSANMTTLIYGSYFGGNCSSEHVDGGTSRFDQTGKIYQSVCAGCGGNDDFPVTAGAWPNTPGNPNHSFNCNNGLFKFDFTPNITTANINITPGSVCAPSTYTFSNASSNYSSFNWIFAPGNTTSTASNPVQTYTNAGNYTVTLIVNNAGSCNLIDSTKQIITISSCTDLKSAAITSRFISFFPNPSKESITISNNNIKESILIELYNSVGEKIMYSMLVNEATTLSIKHLAAGIYYLKASCNGLQQVFKLIKE